MTTQPRSIAIITGPDTLLDHIGVLSQLLCIPLLVTDQNTFDIAKIFYPHLDIHLIDLIDLSFAFLAQNFDIIFQSNRLANMEMSSQLRLLHNKEMRFVYCPHGNSDKGFSRKHHPIQDMSLVYGAHMMNLLEESGAIHQIRETIITGNYRLPFYRKHQDFYDTLAKDLIGKDLLSDLETVLYAPTWQDGENPSSFFSSCDKVVGDLQGRWNVIIKIHPLLEQFYPAETLSIVQRYEKQRGIVFLSKFPAIHPILQLCDLYIGDFSSIGYDFLSFDRPMFFFNTLQQAGGQGEGCLLHQCGISIPIDPLLNLHDFLQSHRRICQDQYGIARSRMYDFAYGQERDILEVKQELFGKKSL